MTASWTCPYCSRACTIGDNDIVNLEAKKSVPGNHGWFHSRTSITVCPNEECRQLTIDLRLYNDTDPQTILIFEPKYTWRLLPDSSAKRFPDYIPAPIKGDYQEACLIVDKSAKASATLSRRCLQGIIRDFWGIQRSSLYLEISALKEKVDTQTWDAIDAVRTLGNIGAHMEKDVNAIIDVDENEARSLIWLIETLLKEWYIASHERKERMKALKSAAHGKTRKKAKKTGAKK